MLSLGLDRGAVGELMKQYGIRDEDYRVSELKRQMGRLKKFAGDKIGEFPAKAKEKIGEFPAKAKKFGKMMVSKDVRADNEEYAEDVVKTAYILMRMTKEGSVSPEDLQKLDIKAAKSGKEGSVSPEDLQKLNIEAEKYLGLPK
jgi:hypothetical protein